MISIIFSLVECIDDQDCRTDQVCSKNTCVDPCLLSNECASNALCSAKNHRVTCKCPSGLIGDPYDHCKAVECLVNEDCISQQSCSSGYRCINPCLDSSPPCAPTAVCSVAAHTTSCSCPSGTVGDPKIKCSPIPEPQAIEEEECYTDSECPPGLACLDKKCLNPCYELLPCDSTSICSVVDTVPFRTIVCSCKYPMHAYGIDW